jgi:hypothetical protein
MNTIEDQGLLPLPPMPPDTIGPEQSSNHRAGIHLQQPRLSASAPFGLTPGHASQQSPGGSSGVLGIGSLHKAAQRRTVRFDQDGGSEGGVSKALEPQAILGLEGTSGLATYAASLNNSHGNTDVHPWVSEQLCKLDRLLSGFVSGGINAEGQKLSHHPGAERVRRQLGGRPWYMDPALVAAPKVGYVKHIIQKVSDCLSIVPAMAFQPPTDQGRSSTSGVVSQWLTVGRGWRVLLSEQTKQSIIGQLTTYIEPTLDWVHWHSQVTKAAARLARALDGLEDPDILRALWASTRK